MEIKGYESSIYSGDGDAVLQYWVVIKNFNENLQG